MRRYAIMLDPQKVEGLRDIARRKAVEQRADLSWADLVREAADRILSADATKNSGTCPEGAQ
ncbi:hypothetical protein VT84_33660 [Gemmata sp. SH-PL17]|uniref:hypothetical protein n=1 Tax=Gemmata sp. SH-PL17 TaxID=1630693 RepID=UPI00078EC249|nr:hypothetical protein [Gemmata sp. SH-PL17]AMV29390.1 hypothetical protein VT84_33660 [Gemmata sp. SH-PL17]